MNYIFEYSPYVHIIKSIYGARGKPETPSDKISDQHIFPNSIDDTFIVKWWK